MDAGGWDGFCRTHLHDYPRAAARFWLILAGVGACALVLALVQLAQLEAAELWQIAGWSAIVVTAAMFPIQIPHSKHSIATGDVVVFLLLALHGTSAAVLGAGLEGFIAASRSSSRLSSRIASLCSAAIGMTVGGALFHFAESELQVPGIPHGTAHLAALTLGVLVCFAINTQALMRIVWLKRGMHLTAREWFENTSWVGALYLLAAVLAGLLSLNAQQFGSETAAVGVLVIGVSVALLRAHFRRRIADDEAQAARLAAAERDAEKNQKRFHSAFTQASIGMAIVSSEGTVLQANQAFHALLGYSEAQLLGREFRELLQPGDATLLARHVTGLQERRDDTFSIELRCRGADKRETWVSLHCSRFDDDASAGAGLIFQLHDITSRRRAEGELRHVAYHDKLTDLANRNCFQERLGMAVERSRQDRRFGIAVMYLDLDRFKLVNDTLGHPAGDEVLKEAARRLVACVRPRDLVARLGGDEFAILVEDVQHQSDVLALGERLLEALKEPLHIARTELRPFASIGVTFSDVGYREPGEMLRDADLAMYKAKADGKGRLALFDASLHKQLGDKLQLEADLRHALAEGGLSLVFQPMFELESGYLIGFEALARWVHPVRGAISPGVFIALAEETGCIGAVTDWAIDEAVRHVAAWRLEGPHVDELVMHVNVSGRDLAQLQLVPHVRAVLKRYGVPARMLVLEITESTLMEERELALHSLTDLRALGVRLSIDDFGTGYSSLAYLSTLPFDCLKIDRSFTLGMNTSPENVEIVRAILLLGRSLNKLVIAEGIETDDQLLRVRRLEVPVGQGYRLSRPLPPAEAQQLLRAAKPVPV